MTTARTLPAPGRVRDRLRFPWPGLRAAVGTLGLVVAIASLLAVRDAAYWRTTYSSGSPESAIADLLAGLGMIAAGWYVGQDRGRRGLSILLMLAGAAWLGSDIVGWQGAAAQLRVLALAGALLFVPLFLHVTTIAPGERVASRTLNGLMVVGYATATALGLILVFAYDPATDPTCWDLCSPNPFLIWPDPIVGIASTWVTVWMALVGGGAIATVAAWRLATASLRRQRGPMFILVPALAAGGLMMARAVAVTWSASAGPADTSGLILFQAMAWAVAATAGGIVLVTRRSRRTRAAIEEMANTEAGTGRMRSPAQVLAAATGDASLSIVYPLADTDGFVDAGAEPVVPKVHEGRALTTITRRGETVALIDHDPRIVSAADLAEHLGPAARLALENERLDAALLAQLREMTASRARIIAAADAERMRRERDLHDGAQQRLLALTYDLVAARDASTKTDPHVTPELDEAIGEVHAAHDELRELAHGIYPAVLTEAGLVQALETLVDRSPIPLQLREEGAGGCDAGVEMTAYLVADELLRDAATRGATRARMEVRHDGDRLSLEVQDDGLYPDAPIIHAEDRAGAAGGSLSLAQLDGGEVAVRLEIRCASS